MTLQQAAQQALTTLEAGALLCELTAASMLRVALEAEQAQTCLKCGAPLGEMHMAAGNLKCGWPGRVTVADCTKQAQAVEPVAWTLTETLDKRVTTTSGYLWFSNPVNCCWTPLYTHPAKAQQVAVPALMTDIEVFRAARTVQSVYERVPHRDVIEFARAIEKHHKIGAKP